VFRYLFYVWLILLLFYVCVVSARTLKGAQLWDFRSLGFSWFLHHKVFLGRRLGGKNKNKNSQHFSHLGTFKAVSYYSSLIEGRSSRPIKNFLITYEWYDETIETVDDRYLHAIFKIVWLWAYALKLARYANVTFLKYQLGFILALF
jgi:hypothetical protein